MELLTQFPASNEENMVYLGHKTRIYFCSSFSLKIGIAYAISSFNWRKIERLFMKNKHLPDCIILWIYRLPHLSPGYQTAPTPGA